MDASIVGYKEGVAVTIDMFLSGMRAVLWDGMPGIGKTEGSRYIQQGIGVAHRFMLKPGHHDVVDFNGLPAADLNTMTAHFLRFSTLLPSPDLEGGCLMVWDEIGDADRPVQNIVCQAILEGGFHNYRFPENTYHFLTTNRVADRSGANRIVTKLGNRLAWFSLQPSVEEVFEYGIGNGWNPTVLAFLKLLGNEPINPNDRAKDGRTIPTYFNSFDPQDPAQMVKPVFASSRSIEFVSNLMNYIDAANPKIKDGALLSRVAGLTGTPWATKFVPFRSEAQVMPDPDAILRGEKIKFPDKESVLWNLTILLVTRCTKNNWKHLAKFIKQGPAEYYILAVRLAFDTRAAQLIGPDFNATLQEPDVQQALKAK